MTTPVSGTSSIATDTATATVGRTDQSTKDTFLKLLVAQMKYQDPGKPADTSQLLSQEATFTQVEQLQKIAGQNASLLSLQRSTSAGVLVGRTVTYTDEAGRKQTGPVSSVVLGEDSTETTVTVGGKPVPMGRITEVS